VCFFFSLFDYFYSGKKFFLNKSNTSSIFFILDPKTYFAKLKKMNSIQVELFCFFVVLLELKKKEGEFF
jgi:hypothetical protein